MQIVRPNPIHDGRVDISLDQLRGLWRLAGRLARETEHRVHVDFAGLRRGIGCRRRRERLRRLRGLRTPGRRRLQCVHDILAQTCRFPFALKLAHRPLDDRIAHIAGSGFDRSQRHRVRFAARPDVGNRHRIRVIATGEQQADQRPDGCAPRERSREHHTHLSSRRGIATRRRCLFPSLLRAQIMAARLFANSAATCERG